MNLLEIRRLTAAGEGPRLEFKRSTADLRGGMQTACAFLNGEGGQVLFGVGPDGALVGQEISDKTLREVSKLMEGFEPPARLRTERLLLPSRREVLVIEAEGRSDTVPFTFEGRAFRRVESTTRKMPQEAYERLLLDRAHSKRRWENQEAENTTLRDIDRQEVHRVAALVRSEGRIRGPIGRDAGRILDRLGARRDGILFRAAVVLFGKRFLPDFPQCEIRLARFRGVDKAEFLDQKMIRGPALLLLEEAEIFCQRHLPVAARIVPEQMARVERPLIPPDALREILVNALIHRDYTIAGGAISLAIYDDRVEIWSAGRFPTGITPKSLSRDHDSVLRNPIIAEVFRRAGLTEKWGRGTNRVIALCRRAGVAPPGFRETGTSVVVTFQVRVGDTAPILVGDTDQVTDQAIDQVTDQVAALLEAARVPRRSSELQNIAGFKHRTFFRTRYLFPLISRGWLEMTVPGRHRSPRQRYRTTPAGIRALKKHRP